jgi:hypothetical protein
MAIRNDLPNIFILFFFFNFYLLIENLSLLFLNSAWWWKTGVWVSICEMHLQHWIKLIKYSSKVCHFPLWNNNDCVTNGTSHHVIFSFDCAHLCLAGRYFVTVTMVSFQSSDRYHQSKKNEAFIYTWRSAVYCNNFLIRCLLMNNFITHSILHFIANKQQVTIVLVSKAIIRCV